MGSAEVVENILKDALGDSMDNLQQQTEELPQLTKKLTKKLTGMTGKLGPVREAVPKENRLIDTDLIADIAGDDMADLLAVMEDLADHPELLQMRGLLSCCVSQKNTIRDWNDLTKRTKKIKDEFQVAWDGCSDVFDAVMDCVAVFDEDNLKKDMKDFDKIPEQAKKTAKVFTTVLNGDIDSADALDDLVGDIDDVLSHWERLLDQLPVHKLSNQLRKLADVFKRAKGTVLSALSNVLKEVNKLFHDILQTLHQIMAVSPMLCCVNPPPAIDKVQKKIHDIQAVCDVSAVAEAVDTLNQSMESMDGAVFKEVSNMLDDFDQSADAMLDVMDEVVDVLRVSVDSVRAAENASVIYSIYTQVADVFN